MLHNIVIKSICLYRLMLNFLAVKYIIVDFNLYNFVLRVHLYERKLTNKNRDIQLHQNRLI